MAARIASELTKWKTSSYSWASEGGTRGPCLPGFWSLTFFYYIFSKKRRFSCFQKEKWNFTTFRPPLERSLWLLLEKSANSLPLVKILPTPMFLIMVDVGADFSRSGWIISNLLQNRVASNIRSKLKHFQTMYSDYLTKLFFNSPNVKLLMKTKDPYNCDWTVTIHFQSSQIYIQNESYCW